MKPYHYRDCVVLLGDAAHAMVPFYGQGLNCGLEDVRVLSTIMHQHEVESIKTATVTTSQTEDNSIDDRLAAALTQYSESRHKDLMAINDLAMEN
jgi:kynurenine 3-monooxygenase